MQEEGFRKIKQTAVYWYEKAATQGYDLAQYNLAISYHFGRGVAIDYNKALYWYEKAAAQGHKNAQDNLTYLKKELGKK